MCTHGSGAHNNKGVKIYRMQLSSLHFSSLHYPKPSPQVCGLTVKMRCKDTGRERTTDATNETTMVYRAVPASWIERRRLLDVQLQQEPALQTRRVLQSLFHTALALLARPSSLGQLQESARPTEQLEVFLATSGASVAGGYLRLTGGTPAEAGATAEAACGAEAGTATCVAATCQELKQT